MAKLNLNTLLQQADLAASRGNWQQCRDLLEKALQLQPGDAGILSGIGTSLLSLGRPDDAAYYFMQVVNVQPESSEAQNNLGLALALAGQMGAAEKAYKEAIDLDPDNAQAWKNLAILYLQTEKMVEGVQILAAVVQSNPKDVDALYMLAQCYEGGQDPGSALACYQEVLKNQPDHPDAQAGVERVQRELTVRKPAGDLSRIARPEHAAKLASLKSLKDIKKPAAASGQAAAAQPAAPARKAVAFYGPPEPATEMRLGPVISRLVKDQWQVKVGQGLAPGDLEQFDTFVFAAPHASPELLAAAQDCVAAGKRVVVDLDLDYIQLPSGYPGYSDRGPGSPQSIKALEELLGKVSLISVSSPVLVERYQHLAQRVVYAPGGWNQENELWTRPAPTRRTFNVGLLGTHLSTRDVGDIKNSVGRFVREMSTALFLVGIDMKLYDAFPAIPEERKLFVPASRIEDYPFLLASFDVLLIPLAKNSFNQAKSDLPLVEAGVRGIPWLASPIPAFRAWEKGGLIVENPGEWHTSLQRLAQQADLRNQLSEEGRDKARSREAETLLPLWKEVLAGSV